MSIMKTIFGFENNRKSRKTHSNKMRFQPQLEPLEDRHLLTAAGLLSTVAGTLGPTDAYSQLELRVDSNGQAPVLGIRIDATTAGFNPSAISVFDSNGSKVPDSAVKFSNADYRGASSSLLLVQLAPGDYFIRVGGDQSTYGSFTCDVFLPGDINRDGSISSFESNMANAAFQYSSGMWNVVTAAAYEKQGIYISKPGVYDITDFISDFGTVYTGRITSIDTAIITANSSAGKVSVSLDTQAEKPVVHAQLVSVAATTATEQITSNPAVKGTLTSTRSVVSFEASFNGQDWTNVAFNSDGTFTVDAEMMKTMTGSPVASNGTVTNGRYEISFKAVDRYGQEATFTLKYVVIADNVAPTANDTTYQANAYDTVSGSLQSLVSHKDEGLGNVLAFVAGTFTSDQGVTVTINANGNFQYVQGDKFASLREGEAATDTFTYKVKDILGRESTGTITIAITGVNAAPYLKNAVPDQTTDQNTEKTIDVLPYFDDPNNGDVLSIKAGSLSIPANSGTVSIVDGKIVFHPGNDFKSLPLGESRTVEITFVITDDAPTPLSVNGSVRIIVTGLNDNPVANHVPKAGDPSLTITRNETIAVTVANTGSTDPDQGETETLVFGWIGRGTQGQAVASGAETRIDFTEGDYVIVGADGKTLTYNPGTRFANNGVGNDKPAEFEYQVKDVHGALSNKAVISLTVLGVNDPPVINDTTPVTASGGKNDVISIPFSEFLQKASDPNGDAMVVSRVELDGTGKGTITVDAANQRVIFNPGNDFLDLTAGKVPVDVTFKFWVKDEHGAESPGSGTGKVTITGSNDLLKINDQTFSITSGGTGTATCTVTTVGYSDSCRFEIVGVPTGGPDGQPMPTFSINETTGVISVGRSGLPSTTPAGQGYKLTVKISNPNDPEDWDEAVITINVVTKAPPVITGGPVVLTTSETATTAVTGPDLRDKIVHDDPFDFLTTLTFKSFSFNGQNHTDTSLTIDGKTYDIAGYVASINATTGVVSFRPNGKFDFLPEDKDGKLILEYTVRDTESGSAATGTIEITISGVNSQPVSTGAIPDQTTNQNTNLTLNVRPFFEDPDVGDVLRVKAGSVTVEGGGTVSINGSGNIVFNPGDAFKHLRYNATATVTVSFVIEDGGGLTVSGSYKITVTGLNDAPVATDYTASATDKNKPTGNIAASTVASDIDTGETATLEFCWIGRGTESFDVVRGQTVTFANGDIVTISPNGRTLTFTPGPTFAGLGAGQDGTAAFQYQVKDAPPAGTPSLTSEKKTITVPVRGLDNPPEILEQIDDQIQTMGTFVVINLLEHFGGNNLIFDFEVGADPSQMLHVTRTGNMLRIDFLNNYNSSNNRIPVSITVTATNSAGTASVSQTFKAAATPQTTLEVVAVPVKEADSSRFNATGTYKSPEDMHVDFEVNVGDRYYLELWVSDTLFKAGGDYANFSRGLAYLVVSLQYDPSVARIVSFQFPLAGNVDDFEAYYGPTGGNISEPGLISGLGGGISTGFAGQGLGANNSGFKMVRILVEAVGAGNPNFEFLRPESSDDWNVSEFYFSRLTTPGSGDGLDITNDQVKTYAPSITHAAPAPLLAAETPEKIVTGGVYPRVATTPTTTSANGTVADIPDNADWIHEWQTHWVELWVKAPEAAYFLNGTCDLNYNTNYFTAVEVELSPAFRGNSNPVIHDALGKITGIGGNATQLVSGDGYVLLGRVKFQSIGTDNVPFEEAWFAHDLGISLENVKVTTSANEVLSYAGKSPRTELWAVPYDTNDSGSVQAMDYTQFLSAFVDSREQNSYLLSLFDFNKDGKVDAQDYTFFLAAFGITRDSGVPVPFPQSFTQRYVGKKLDADSATTVNKIIDAANKAWQTALGLDRPVEIQIIVQDFGAGNDQLANAQITAVDAKGLPLKGIITLDSTAAGMGWYSQIDEPVANGRYDLFTVLLHEMGHIYGFNTSYDAFNAVVGEYVSQLDKSGLHAADPNDVMYATLETGIRKYISTFNVAIITSAYDAAQADPALGFSSSTAALSAAALPATALSTATLSTATLSTTALTTATLPTATLLAEALPVNPAQPDPAVLLVQKNGGFVTTLSHPVLAFAAPQNSLVDTDTAMRLHALGLAVTMPLNMQQREENRFSFAVEQIYNDEESFFDLTDDDLVTLHQPQDADESELALMFGLAMDLDA